MQNKPPSPERLTSEEIYLFNEGSYFKLYEKLGAHPITLNGHKGTMFRVWAPDAWQVCVMGDFNGWNNWSHKMTPVESSGIWELFVPGVMRGDLYKYRVYSRYNDYQVDKSDPIGFCCETPL